MSNQQEKRGKNGESSSSGSAPDAAALARARAEKEERRRLKMIELQQKGIIDKKGASASKPTMSRAERRAKQEHERAAKQAGAAQGDKQKDAKEPSHHHHHHHSANVGADGTVQQASAGAHHVQTEHYTMTNRVFQEDKRMYLYSHLDLPHHPPSSASALAPNQTLNTSNAVSAEGGTGDAGVFVAGIKNSAFPPGPQVVVGMARDAYVAAESGEPASVPVPGGVSGPSEAILRDAVAPYANGPGERKIAKSTNQTAGMAIHPRIKEVGLRMGTMEITGANARAVSVLAAFIDVIADYTTPPQTSLYRHLLSYISPQINFIVHQRPMCVGIGNAIRWLKDEIMRIPADMDEATAKSVLITRILDYVKERITAAGDVIADSGAQKIKDGDVVLTFGASSTVQRLLLAAHRAGRRFRVIVIDSRPQFEGRKLVRRLVEAGMADLSASGESGTVAAAPSDLGSSRGKGRGRNGANGGVTYAPITALGFIMREASKVFLGAEAFFANGAMLSRAGTAMVGLAARSHHVPVIVACETYKFSERVQLDAVVSNELGVPDALMYKAGIPDAQPVGSGNALTDQSLAEMEYSAYARDRYSARPRWNNRKTLVDESVSEITAAGKQGKQNKQAKQAKNAAMMAPGAAMEARAEAKLRNMCPLSDWRETKNLRLLNLVQDITPPDFVSMIITEVGMIPTTSIPVVLREYKNQV